MISLASNCQFATLPDSPDGYKAKVSVGFKLRDFGDDIATKEPSPYHFDMTIPANLIYFRFTDHTTADHEVAMESNVNEIEKLVNKKLEKSFIPMDQVDSILVYLPLEGKHVIEWDKLPLKLQIASQNDILAIVRRFNGEPTIICDQTIHAIFKHAQHRHDCKTLLRLMSESDVGLSSMALTQIEHNLRDGTFKLTIDS